MSKIIPEAKEPQDFTIIYHIYRPPVLVVTHQCAKLLYTEEDIRHEFSGHIIVPAGQFGRFR